MNFSDKLPALQQSVSDFNTVVDQKQTIVDGKVTSSDAALSASITAKNNTIESKIQTENFSRDALTDLASMKANIEHQNLAALAASKVDNAVDIFIYDTSKDSDGGAWRYRTKGTSWYNEKLNTATRGSRREFPAVAVIVVQNNGIITIYDGDDPTLPIWMKLYWNINPYKFSIYAMNGIIAVCNNYVPNSSYGGNGLALWDFPRSIIRRSLSNGSGSGWFTFYENFTSVDNIDAGPINSSFSSPSSRREFELISYQINDVAMTVLPNAPIDPATGLPIPTIAVATAGGVSVIKDDGTIVDFYTSHNDYNHSFNVNFSDNGLWFDISVSSNLAGWTYFYKEIPENDTLVSVGAKGTADSFYNGNAFVVKDLYLLGTTNKIIENNNIGTTSGVAKVHQKLEIPENGMVNHLNSSYNTGWMPGDIKGAFLADTDDTDIVGSGELVDNGGFDTDGGWILGTGWSITGGVAKATGVTSDTKYMEQNIGLVAGKLYRYEFTTSGNLTGTNYFALRFGGVSDDFSVSQAKTYSGTIVASGSGNLRIRSEASTNDITIDNISVQLADADRSVNNKALIVSSTEYEPDLDLLFTTENYTVNNQVSDFESALIHTRDSNATMVDSDGLLKWAPHNLITYSEDQESRTISIVDSTIVGNVLTATNQIGLQSPYFRSSLAFPSSGKYTLEVDVTNVSGWTEQTIIVILRTFSTNTNGDVLLDMRDGSIPLDGYNSSVTAIDGGYRLKIEDINAYSDDLNGVLDIGLTERTDNIIRITDPTGNETATFNRITIYRSDLGGMVNNPDTGDSYVPTTSSARYLPRRGHHTWDGSNWVNSGLLLESETRANQIDYSEKIDQWSITESTITPDATIAPDGTSTADKFIPNTNETYHYIHRSSTSTIAGTRYAYSFYAKAAGYSIVTVNGVSTTWGTQSATFNLVEETATGINGASAYIENVGNVGNDGNNWYRCVVLMTANGSYGGTTARQVIFVNDENGAILFSGNDTSGVYIWGVQMEEGAIASSYIPNNTGDYSVVTRTAETLTVPAANMPYPEINYIGSNIVTNGTFNTDLSGWNASGTGTVTWVNEQVELSGPCVFEQQPVTTESGVFIVSWDQTITAGTRTRLRLRNAIDNADVGPFYYFVGSGSYSVIVTTNSGLTIQFYTEAADTALIDNISVREIDPLSSTIQMEGEINFVDRNATEVNFFIRQTGSEYIKYEMDTLVSTDTGRSVITQQIGSKVNTTTGGVSEFIAGLNSPYNISLRFGSNFSNYAVNGTAATQIDFDVGFPRNENANLILAENYMGTIKRFRVFDEDIADTGIEKATSYQPLIKSVGTITRTPVATGAELVTYSGFSATDYLYQPYNSNLDFGTGDFCVMFWMRHFTNSLGSLVSFLGNPGDGTTGWALSSSYGNVRFSLYDGSSTRSALTPSDVAIDEMKHICCVRIGDIVYIYVNGEFVISNSGFSSYDVSTTNGILKIGDSSTSAFLALLRITATVPTEQQILKIYNDEKHLFKENAKCTLYGSSDAVTALAYDDTTNLLHVGTSAGRSVFRGLERVDNTTTPVTTAIAAKNGLIVEQ